MQCVERLRGNVKLETCVAGEEDVASGGGEEKINGGGQS